jgi:hypothetical protein
MVKRMKHNPNADSRVVYTYALFMIVDEEGQDFGKAHYVEIPDTKYKARTHFEVKPQKPLGGYIGKINERYERARRVYGDN